MIALFGGLCIFLLRRGHSQFYYELANMTRVLHSVSDVGTSYRIEEVATWPELPVADAYIWAGILGFSTAVLLYLITTRHQILGSIFHDMQGTRTAALLNALTFFALGTLPAIHRPYFLETVSMGVFVAAGSITSVSTYWYLFLRSERTHLAEYSQKRLRHMHMRYLEFVRLLSYTATILITGAWVVTWSYWWIEQPLIVRESRAWILHLADQALVLFLMLAGFYFGVIRQFMRQLVRIESHLRD